MSGLLTVFGVDLTNIIDVVAKPLAVCAVVGMIIFLGYEQGGFV